MLKFARDLWELAFQEQTRLAFFAAYKTLGRRRIWFLSRRFVSTGGVVKALTGRRNEAVPDMVEALWDSLGDQQALSSRGKSFTFDQFKERVFRLGNALAGLGLQSPDKVGVMLFNTHEFLETVLASSFLGLANPALNWHLSGNDLAEAIKRSAPKALVVDHGILKQVLEVRDQIPSVKHFIVVGAGGKFLPKGVHHFDKLLEAAPATRPRGRFMVGLNPYTGGTTGVPKSINYFDAYRTFMGTAENQAREGFLEFLKLVNRQLSMIHYFNAYEALPLRSMLNTPMYHAGALAGALPFALGGTLVMKTRFDPEDALKTIQDEKISWWFTVPTMLQRILALPEEVKAKYDLSSMRVLISSAAPCPTEVKQATSELFLRQGARGPVFHEFYGSAEAGIITALIPEDYQGHPHRLASVGRPRGGDLLVLDEQDRPLARGETGRVHLRSMLTSILRYIGSEEKLSKVIKTVGGKAWYDDGLVGHVDQDGFLFLTGREKELIIMGGVNVYPMEIEQAILRDPRVLDVGVVGIPDADLGEKVHAEVQLKAGETATEQDILEHCKKEGLFGFKLPASVAIVEDLPRHIDGKLIKREIRDKYLDGVNQIG